MKTLSAFLVVLIAFCAKAQDYNEALQYEVDNFSADYYLNKDGSADVVERYDINFLIPMHGIIRTFLIRSFLDESLVRKDERTLYFSKISVKGAPYTKTSDFGRMYDNWLDIKIGDKDKLITGPAHFEISYKVRNVMLLSNDRTAFYWNVKTDDWDAPFNRIEFRIHTPDGNTVNPNNSLTYDGIFDNEEISQNFEYQYRGGVYSAVSKPGWSSPGNENVTALVYVPKHLIPKNNLMPVYFRRYQWIGILLLVFLIWRSLIIRLKNLNRTISVTAYYPPENVDPAMAGYLINDSEDSSDLIALLPKWGNEKLIKIEENKEDRKKDVLITRLAKIGNDVPDYEKYFFNQIFSKIANPEGAVSVNNLKSSFYESMNTAKSKLKDAAQKYYDKKLSKRSDTIFAFVIFLGIAAVCLFFFFYGILAAVCCFFFFLFLAVGSIDIKVKTKEAARMFDELEGFKKFIELAEISRIRELLKSDPEYFEKTMGYALAFGMLDKWAQKFEGLDVKPPEWYSSNMKTTNLALFSNSFGNSMFIASSSLKGIAPVASSSSYHGYSRSTVRTPFRGSSFGGGRSGGGFGGGGGRGW